MPTTIRSHIFKKRPISPSNTVQDTFNALEPLYVDLDGTLTPVDTLHEALTEVLRSQPLALPQALRSLLKGKSAFKATTAQLASLDASTLPYNQHLLELLRAEKQKGRKLILTSAADIRIVRAVAEYLQIFDDIIATNQHDATNLSGANKQAAIAAHAAALGFTEYAYAGNSHDDLAVWEKASLAIAVDTPASVLKKLRQQHSNIIEMVAARQPLKVFLKSIRINNWSKNALIFLPLLAAHCLEVPAWTQALLAFLAFGLCASGTYLINDLLDIPNDRSHPIKSKRPLASGRMPVLQGCALSALLLAAAAVTALSLSPAFFLTLLIYTALTLSYSVKLKKIAILDILVLAFLYTIRIIAGGVASNIQISKWLLAISIFVFISLALAKRCAEITRIKNAGLAKIQGRGYFIDDLETVRSMGIASGFMSALVLALYIESPTSFINYNFPELLWITPPIFLAWIMRIWIKTGRNELTGEDPLQFSLKDKPSWICLSLIFIFASIAMVGEA